MNHLTDEQLTMAYYGEEASETRTHLESCSECQAALKRLAALLEEVREYPVPERGEAWEAEVWARLAPQLPERRPRREWFGWWVWAPALAAMLAIAFFAGMLTQRQRTVAGFPAKSRERILLVAMGDHLDRSEMVVAELANAAPGTADIGDERVRARDLLDENRLLRQTALRNGDVQHAALLDELERVLMDIAHTKTDASDEELRDLQHRIESEGLLFRMRIIRSNIREKGRNL